MENQPAPGAGEQKAMPMMRYGVFARMIAASTLIMFALMYLNTYRYADVFFSQTRAWMALLMGAAMSAVMLVFMWKMYPRRNTKLAILAGSIGVFCLSLWLVRSQATVDDTAYMRAMIPHHSIAILTSTRARIADPRVRRLADRIAATQLKEIAEMEELIADIEAKR